jgi:hypothetical protein
MLRSLLTFMTFDGLAPLMYGGPHSDLIRYSLYFSSVSHRYTFYCHTMQPPESSSEVALQYGFTLFQSLQVQYTL